MPVRVELHERAFTRFISAEAIAGRISKLALELAERLDQVPSLVDGKPPVFLGILNGAAIFHADLVRACDFALEIAYVRTRSYDGLKSTGTVNIEWPAGLDLRGRHVVVVEDIIDSGLTVAKLADELQRQQSVASLTTIVLLDKPTARVNDMQVDHVGFEIENKFVVGYGLDFDGLGRNLPSIYQLDQ